MDQGGACNALLTPLRRSGWHSWGVSYEVTIEQRDAQQAVVMSAALGREQIPEFLGSAYGSLFAQLAQRGVSPGGPPFARYQVDNDSFHVTAGVPVGQVPEGLPGGTLPGGLIATTLHVGSYEGLPEAFHAVIDWVGSNGYRIAADPWESYLDDPSVAEPRTQVCFPVETV